MGCVINSNWERVLCCTISSGESHHEPRHQASEGILKWNRQSFVISSPQSLFKLINTAVRWWTRLILYCWARPHLSNVILWVMPLDLLGIYFTCISQMQSFNLPSQNMLANAAFCEGWGINKIEPTLLQFHSPGVKCVGTLFHIQSVCYNPQCCTMDIIHKFDFWTHHFLVFTDSKLCQTEHFKRPIVKLAVAVEIDTTFCLIGSKPGEGLPSSKIVSKPLLGHKVVMRRKKNSLLCHNRWELENRLSGSLMPMTSYHLPKQEVRTLCLWYSTLVTISVQ